MQVRSALAIFLGFVLPAQPQASLPLTIDGIMRGPELYGYAPRAVRWSGDGQKVYFQWKRASDPLLNDYDTYVANRDGSGLRKLSEDETKEAPPASGVESRDGKRMVLAERGDIVLYDRPTGKRRLLTRTTENEAAPRFTRDEKRVSFTRGGNLYTLSLEDGTLAQLTDIRPAAAAGAAPAPAAPPAGTRGGGGRAPVAQAAAARGNESQEALKKAERALLDIVEQRAKKREEEEAKRKKEEAANRKPFQLTARQTAGALLLSPDGTVVAVSVMETAEGVRNTAVTNYITETGYSESLPSRAKVGDAVGRSRVALVAVQSGEVKWIDTGLGDRPVQLLQPLFNEDGSALVISARSQDNKDRWIFAVDKSSGKCRELYHLRDEAWINGPGSFTVGWLGDNQTVYYQSEQDGYSHLYTVSVAGGAPKQLTSGPWEVESVVLSRDKSTFWLTTSEGSPFERHLYSMSVHGGARTRLTSETGNHSVTLSPDESFQADIYSFTTKPPELYLRENKPGAAAVKVTDSPAPEFWSYKWQDAAPIFVPARDGKQVPAQLFKPDNWKPGGPAVIFVHGAGYIQNVHRWWSSYSREYMFHHLLRDKGYMVVALDYRASAGYGRDWRAAIYRHMGGIDLDDQVDAARWLVKEHGVDPKRIGLYGGSYGGFITLMALFTQPDVFAAGAAMRPVTDWAHYNQSYTSNILNLPQQDREAYEKSSPIYFASGLKGALLICHGIVDVNVHFQDTVRLVQKLIELRKENWELAVYPVEDHGFVQPTSWSDEYKRIFKLFETNLKKDWPPSPAPAKTRRK